MSVFVTIPESADEKPNLTAEQILLELEKSGIKFGIDNKAIVATVDLYNSSGSGVLKKVIASGKRAVHGKNGQIEWLVKKPDFNAKSEKDGTIDFHEIDTFTQVQKKQPVLRIIPPVSGVDGKDVLGENIPAKEGTPAKFPKIQNTEILQSDSNVLISSIDGCVRFTNNTLEISPLLEISGDVDFSTGNIRFEGSVKIYGDVRSGFEILADDNIYIDGTVENAILRAQGDVTIRGGFVGTGKGLIQSEGIVTVGYVRNQQIESNGSIFIKKEAVSCRLSSKDKIVISGKLIGFAGGSAFAANGMDIFLLGSKTGVKTEIHSGTDHQETLTVNDISSQINVLKEQSSRLETQLFGIESARIKRKAIFNKLFDKIDALKNEKIRIDKTIEVLTEKKQSLKSSPEKSSNPQIRVAGEVYPGTTIVLNGSKRLIEETIQRCLFYSANGKVLHSPLV